MTIERRLSPQRRCTSCNKSEHEVKVLVHMAPNFYTCNECVEITARMVYERGDALKGGAAHKLALLSLLEGQLDNILGHVGTLEQISASLSEFITTKFHEHQTSLDVLGEFVRDIRILGNKPVEHQGPGEVLSLPTT